MDLTAPFNNAASPNRATPPPVSLYVHVPFCRHRCGYCNFALVANRPYLVQRYLRAIESELSQLPDMAPLRTLYFGGGTPSHLDETDFGQLMSAVTKHIPLGPVVEISLEANPQDVTPERVALWRSLGVTRVSLGVQSFESAKLKILERDHDRHQIELAVKLLKQASLTISLDLIFGTPGETIDNWMGELEKANALPIHHLSTYELTYEKGTVFWNRMQRGELQRLDEDLRGDLYAATIDFLRQNDWQQYEISSFSRDGNRCRHNVNYWNGNSWLAVGPSAASYFQGQRWTNHASPVRYLQLIEANQSAIAFHEQLPPNAAARELLAVGLRQIDGINIREYCYFAGMSPQSAAGNAIDRLIDLGMLEVGPEIIKLTRSGLMVYDSIAAELLAAR